MTATVAQIRLLVADLIPNNVYDDSHYEAIVAMNSNVYRAGAIAANALAAFYATKISTTVGKIKISNEQKFKHYQKLSVQYTKWADSGANKIAEFIATGAGAPEITGVVNSEIDTAHDDTDRYKAAFRRGVLDNPSGTDNIVDPYGDE